MEDTSVLNWAGNVRKLFMNAKTEPCFGLFFALFPTPTSGFCPLLPPKPTSIQWLLDFVTPVGHWLIWKIDFYRVLFPIRKGLAQPFFDEIGRLLSTGFTNQLDILFCPEHDQSGD